MTSNQNLSKIFVKLMESLKICKITQHSPLLGEIQLEKYELYIKLVTSKDEIEIRLNI